MIAQSGWNTEKAVQVQVTDGALGNCMYPNTVISSWSDWINFNPGLDIIFEGGPVDFGTVEAGTAAVSNTVYVRNAAENGSGVVMDMYLASDDYFTDPNNPNAICPTGNGIKFDQFRYYATKGSVNSGPNNNMFNNLATHTSPFEECVDIQDGDWDEYVQLPSHSGDIKDMCHIINWIYEGSLLTQGSEMSVTFKLMVPAPCQGNFTQGQFHLVGRVV
ncbi:MAG: hypothetical protein V1740_05400 [Candidatus Woesearchaeota archaeon]